MYKNTIKRVFDILASFLGLILFCPFFLVVATGLLIAYQGTPFFTQYRPGKDAIPYKLIKFKTMKDRPDPGDKALSDNERLTAIGRLIRKTSLDEIPQLINVLKGEMSLVGPRPLLIEYLPLYNDYQARRHEVRPGITGWAQVNGRNAVSWVKKFEMDIWYVENISFKLDIKILFLTAFKVIKREGINSSNITTMERFTGS
jgi:undecaprenyl phosphate N,N'-diacetylbacillosamine 1-phosphate transferase